MKVTTIAGKSGRGFKDGKLSEALFNYPRGLCFDKEGNLLVVDCGNHCIRKIDLNNEIVTTIAGCGEGFVDGNALTEAKFNGPSYLAINDDIIYVSDTGNNAIRKMSRGIVSTFATGFNLPYGITLDNNGNILIADYWNHSIKRIDSNNGSIYTFPKSIKYPNGITVSSNGIIYVSTNDGIISYWNDDNWKIIIQTNSEINGLKIDSFNNLLFVESGSHCIKKMNLNGEISLFAGSEEGNYGNLDGLLLESRFNFPFDITMNNTSIYISDCDNHTIRKISLLGLWNKGKKEKHHNFISILFYFLILFFQKIIIYFLH